MPSPAIAFLEAVRGTAIEEHTEVAHDPPKLNTLRPTPLLPSKLIHRRIKSIVALKKIEFLEVTKEENDVFAIDIYYREVESRIPVHRQFAARQPTIQERKRSKPSATIHRSLQEFMQFAHEAYDLTRLSHILDKCPFCRHVLFYNTTSELKPRWNAHWFKNDREISAMLLAYLNAILKEVVEVPTCGVDLCRGQERVPRLLENFLQSAEPIRHSI